MGSAMEELKITFDREISVNNYYKYVIFWYYNKHMPLCCGRMGENTDVKGILSSSQVSRGGMEDVLHRGISSCRESERGWIENCTVVPLWVLISLPY
jgi:hypothetical protein